MWQFNRTCLAGGTPVTTKTGVKMIENLCPGEELLTFSKNNNLVWSRCYTWSRWKFEKLEEFLVLRVGGVANKELIISSEHLVFVVPKEGCGKITKIAGQICIGERLIHFDSKGVMNLCSVTEISVKLVCPVYSPMTITGDFIANGFLVGCYANLTNFEMAHAAMAPLRFWHKLLRSKDFPEDQTLGKYSLNLSRLRGIFLYRWEKKSN